jgi:ATP-dependent DNA helicase RecQ
MKDQVRTAQQRGVEAAAVHAAMSKYEVDCSLNNCIYGSIKFLYVRQNGCKLKCSSRVLSK